MKPDDWPFENLKLGEYISLARQAAKIARERTVGISDAVEEVLAQRSASDRERAMLIQKTHSIVFLGLEDE